MSALENAEFMDQCLDELLSSESVSECDVAPYICSLLSVVENSLDKKRSVTNLRHFNRFLFKQNFKHEDFENSYVVVAKR